MYYNVLNINHKMGVLNYLYPLIAFSFKADGNDGRMDHFCKNNQL
jgi:hypothetical protein